ncbi:hypothetical protein Fmac_008937 [Flemingia macrophylla]|uniref:Pentatricopeptide repeat-containing protein n=1 Tax=Flemingia macrophylla TaxID=520843 RepID=A0ABD1MZN8_9FABA
MAPAASSPPPSFGLSVADHRKDDESKCAYLVVALCPCLVCFILLLVALSVVLVVKFHFFCHTPLHSLLYQKKLLISHLATFSPLFLFHEKFPFLNCPRAFAKDSDSGVANDADGGCDDRNMEAVLDECGVRLSHDLVVDVLQRFRHARKPACRFFCWAGKRHGFAHDSRTYNCMMCILGRTRQFETMVALLEEMGEKGLLTMETFSIAIQAFAEAKQRKKAVGIFYLMKKHEVDVGVINFLLVSLGKAKLGKEAQVVFEKLEGRFTPDLQTYTKLLSGWCKIKNLLEAGRVWNEMTDRGFKPDIVVHNIMLEGLLKCRKKSDAIKLFEIMKAKDRGCQADAALYTCLILGFGRQKMMDMVYNLLREMRERGCSSDGRTYNALIKLMTSQHMPDDAVRIYKKMLQSGIKSTIHTYNMLMKSYFVAKYYEMGHAVWERSSEACKYLEEMLEKGMRAPQLDYSKFASDISKTGNAVMLEELARKMNLIGKFEVSNVLASWVDSMKKSARRREPTNMLRSLFDCHASGQGCYNNTVPLSY